MVAIAWSRGHYLAHPVSTVQCPLLLRSELLSNVPFHTHLTATSGKRLRSRPMDGLVRTLSSALTLPLSPPVSPSSPRPPFHLQQQCTLHTRAKEEEEKLPLLYSTTTAIERPTTTRRPCSSNTSSISCPDPPRHGGSHSERQSSLSSSGRSAPSPQQLPLQPPPHPADL